MSTLTLLDAIERPSILGPDRDACEHHEAAVGGAPTLDDLLTRSWATLTSDRAVACLMCGGEMEPRYGAGYVAVAGRCTRCGTELS